MDTIALENIHVETVIGTGPEERLAPRSLLVSLRLSLDLRAAGERDDLSCSVDYAELTRKIAALGRTSDFYLLEAFAEECARLGLSYMQVVSVWVRVVKPGVLPEVDTIAIEVNRSKSI